MHCTEVAYLLLIRSPGFDSQHTPQKIRGIILMLLTLISGAGYKKVSSGLKMLIEAI